MTPRFQVQDYAALPDTMEFGDRSGLAEADLREMCLMSLQDLELEEASHVVLVHIIGAELRDG